MMPYKDRQKVSISNDKRRRRLYLVMKLLIDIPTDKYNSIVFNDVDKLRECVKNGKVIEKCDNDCEHCEWVTCPKMEERSTSDDEIIKALKAVRTFHNGNYAPQIDEAIRRLEEQTNRCDSCTHSEEQDGSNCCECVKGMADNFEAQPTEMRDATEEERKSVKDYIESISKPTGLHFYKSQPTDAVDKRSLDSVIDTLQTWIRTADDEYDREEYWRVQGLWEALQEIKKIKTFESSTNLVDRDAVIHLINHSLCDLKRDTDKQIFINTINSLPYVIPQQTSEDCVSRTELLSRIDAERIHLLSIKMDDAEHIIVQHARRIIENMPSVQTQRKPGRWIHREDMDYLDKNKVMHIHFMCQDCGFIHDFIDGHTAQYKYCPNCGSYNGGGEYGNS